VTAPSTSSGGSNRAKKSSKASAVTDSIGISALVACGEALQEGLLGRRQVDEQWASSRGPDGLLPLVAIGTTPEAVVEDDGTAGAQQLRKLCSYGLDRGGLALEIFVLGVVDAVPAVEAVNLLVNAETDNAHCGESLCKVRLARAGDPDE
jgi:hypothetical protein